ncbi:MAG: hypothetical protein H7249_13340 [Chitinophagaceae bacterium]|nr:hypothetical protein [Oligoflexus sp.]
MKHSYLLMLSFLSSSVALAADLVPTQFKVLETDLARSELKLTTPYAYRLGLSYDLGRRYILEPMSSNLENATAIRREANFGLMLPLNIEVGASLYGTQENSASVAKTQSSIGGAAWVRYHILQSDSFDSSILAQYEPGVGGKDRFNQLSGARTSVALHVDGSPFVYTQAGLFVGGSSRGDEYYRGSRYNSEMIYGTRVSVGVDAFRLFGEAEVRSIPGKLENGSTVTKNSRQFEAGFSLKRGSLAFQLAADIATKKVDFGVPDHGYHAGVQWMFDAPPVSKPITREFRRSEPEVAPKSNIKSIDNFDALHSDADDQKLGAIPIINDETPRSKRTAKGGAETLTLPGADEFQKWDAEAAAQKNRPETAAEKADKVYRLQVAQEKKAKELKAKKDQLAAQAEKARISKEQDLDSPQAKESAADIDKELNQYTLPDRDDVTWNGLNK